MTYGSFGCFFGFYTLFHFVSDVFAWFFDILNVFYDLGTNTHQTHRLLLPFGGLRIFHSSFLNIGAREKLFTTRNNISKQGITSKKQKKTFESSDVIPEKK